MEDKWQFPDAFSGVEDCRIPMKCPHGGNEARKKIKKKYLMGISGAEDKFLWTSIGLPGSSNDAFTFQTFRLYQNVVGNDLLPEIQKVVKLPNGNELQLPPILLGDSAFPHHV